MRRIAVVETGDDIPRGWTTLRRGVHFGFSTAALRHYVLGTREDVIVDAIALAAAVEYADSIARRRSGDWARHFVLDLPVCEPERWNSRDVMHSLTAVLNFLTGDVWEFRFRKSRNEKLELAPSFWDGPVPAAACMPYSAGLDSLSVSELEKRKLKERLILVRVQRGAQFKCSTQASFATVPYWLSYKEKPRDAGGRSRGFKFALISGLAAYLTKASSVIFPESGQGVFGPVLAVTGHSYPDYRSHPLFTLRMESFLKALLGSDIRYGFPRKWSTKGETLGEFFLITENNGWRDTKSCWRDSRWSAVMGLWRHCGVCAACMLRRVSVHAANLDETADTYVCVDMEAGSLEAAVDPEFSKLNSAYREYAIAGTLHMRRMAEIAGQTNTIEGHAAALAPVLGMEVAEIEMKIRVLFERHREEWVDYMESLGDRSFVRRWGTLN